MNIGVHTSHCCKWHGCRYGENNKCPVQNGNYKQEYPCESCSFEYEEYKIWKSKMQDPKFHEFLIYYQGSNLT